MNKILKKYNLLSHIYSPSDLQKLSKTSLLNLSKEIRSFLVESLNISGGHFASSLGVVELTIALHYVYSMPKDSFVWDIGHQSYIHKILTGRADKIVTIKKKGGLSGFPKRTESEYDKFGVGHSSTSLSAALGISEANKLLEDSSKSVAIIGDGGLTGGIAFEALNHAGGMNSDILIVLNDNGMSISKNVGGLNSYLLKNFNYDYFTRQIPFFKNFAFLEKLRNLTLIKKPIFKEFFNILGFNYFGPVDGHNLFKLIKILRLANSVRGPKCLHIITKKGKGYKDSEENPIKFHYVNPKFKSYKKNSSPTTSTYSSIFSSWICLMAKNDKNLVAITPAMGIGSKLVDFSKQYPARYFDVGISEQHAVTFAAGLSCKGFKPVIAIYSTFLQRAYDQFIHDVSIQNLDILYAVDRAGIVGSDGATHSGIFDISFMRCIPNIVIMTPSDENELFHMLTLGYNYRGPAVVRYPKRNITGKVIVKKLDLTLGRGIFLRYGKKITILNFGALLPLALEAAEIVDSSVVDMRFVKPLDENLLSQIAQSNRLIITLEENVKMGGAGSAVNEYLIDKGLTKNVFLKNIGLPDYYPDQGENKEILTSLGLSVKSIVDVVKQFTGRI